MTSLRINKRVDPGSDPYRNVHLLTVHSLCHKTWVRHLAHTHGERCDTVAHLGKCHGDPQNSPSRLATVLAEPGENTLLLIRNEVTRLSRRRDSRVTSLRINKSVFSPGSARTVASREGLFCGSPWHFPKCATVSHRSPCVCARCRTHVL